MAHRLALLGLVIVALAVPATAEESGIPHLDEHQFVPVLAITEPFMTTHLQTDVGLGWTVNAKQPLFNPIDSTVVGEIASNQFLTGIGVVYQQGVKDWLVVRLRLGVAGRLGTDTSSLLNDGITGALEYEVGWMMRVYRSRSVLVSGSVSLSSANATFVSVSDWSEAQQAGEDAELVRPRTSLRGSGGAHAAWGINHRFGLLGSVFGRYGETFDGDGDNAWYSDLRLALSYDAREDLDLPVGFALTGGRSENDVNSGTDEGTWFWNLRLAGIRSDFTAGVSLQSAYFDVSDQSDRLQFFEIKLDMRYYY
jgi:hypothetical protein